MGRYLPRSDVDHRMALAFAAAGQLDSARVCADHVRRAWAEGEPEAHEPHARLDSLVPTR